MKPLIKIAFCFLFFAETLQAYNLQIAKSPEDQKMYGYMATCSELENEARSLQAWKLKADKINCELSPVEQKNRYCQIDVTSCLPEHVLKYNHKTSKMDGPNCWNTALVMAGLLPHLRYSKPDEFSFFLQEPLCRELSNDEVREPGDIGAIRTYGNKETHGFIYVSENLVYSKNGYRREAPFELQPTEKMINIYEDYVGYILVPQYFRCQSMDKFLTDNSNTIRENIFEAVEYINRVDCELNQTMIDIGRDNGPITSLTIATLSIMVNYFNSEVERLDTLNEKEKFLLTSIKLRLVSVLKALKFVMDHEPSSPANSKIQVLRQLIENSVVDLEQTLNPAGHSP